MERLSVIVLLLICISVAGQPVNRTQLLQDNIKTLLVKVNENPTRVCPSVSMATGRTEPGDGMKVVRAGKVIIREEIKLKKQIQDLKYESLTISAELMQASRQSNVLNQINERGVRLIRSYTPPIVITDSTEEDK